MYEILIKDKIANILRSQTLLGDGLNEFSYEPPNNNNPGNEHFKCGVCGNIYNKSVKCSHDYKPLGFYLGGIDINNYRYSASNSTKVPGYEYLYKYISNYCYTVGSGSDSNYIDFCYYLETNTTVTVKFKANRFTNSKSSCSAKINISLNNTNVNSKLSFISGDINCLDSWSKNGGFEATLQVPSGMNKINIQVRGENSWPTGQNIADVFLYFNKEYKKCTKCGHITT